MIPTRIISPRQKEQAMGVLRGTLGESAIESLADVVLLLEDWKRALQLSNQVKCFQYAYPKILLGGRHNETLGRWALETGRENERRSEDRAHKEVHFICGSPGQIELIRAKKLTGHSDQSVRCKWFRKEFYGLHWGKGSICEWIRNTQGLEEIRHQPEKDNSHRPESDQAGKDVTFKLACDQILGWVCRVGLPRATIKLIESVRSVDLLPSRRSVDVTLVASRTS